MRKSVIIWWLMVCVNFLHGQSTMDHSVDEILLPSGRKIGRIFDLAQDPLGFVWIGSENGLYRFDGSTLENASTLFNQSALNDLIHDLTLDENGVLYVACFSGLYQLDGLKCQKVRLPATKEDWVSSVCAVGKSIYFVDYDGLVCKDESGVHRLSNFSENLPKHRRASSSIAHIGKELWIGTLKGIYVYNLPQQKGAWKQLQQDQEIHDDSENAVESLFFDEDAHKVFIGTWSGGLKIYDLASKSLESFTYALKNPEGFRNIIVDIVKLGTNRYLLSTVDAHFQEFNYRTGKFAPYPLNALSPQEQGSVLLKDQEHSLWFGTNSSLYYKMNELQAFVPVFQSKDFLEDFCVLDGHMFVQRGDRILEVNREHGIPSENLRFECKSGEKLIGMKVQGNFLLALTSQRLIRMPAKQGQFKVDHVSRHAAVRFYLSGRTLILFPFMKKAKVQLLEPTTQGKILKEIFAHIQDPVSFYETSEYYAVGTYRNGVYIFSKKGKQLAHLLRYKGQRLQDIYSVVADDSGKLWFSTFRQGIFEYDLRQTDLRKFEVFNGLIINSFYGIEKGEGKLLYFASNRGLVCFDTQTKKGKLFDASDGLHEPNLERGILYDRVKKIVYIPQIKSVLAATPQWQKVRERKTCLKSIRINGVARSLQKSYDLPYDENSIDIQLTNFSFHNYQLNQFLYKILGRDTDWKYNYSGSINFDQLKPGNYTILLSTLDAYGNQSSIEKIELRIRTPFWESWWFPALIICAIAAVFYFIYRYRIRQLNALYTLRNKLSADLHDDIGSSISSIRMYADFSLNNSKSNELREEASRRIIQTTADVTEKLAEIVWSIQPKNDSTEHIYAKFRSFSDPILQAKGIRARYQFSDVHLKVSGEERRGLYLFYKECIHNIVKHSGATEVTVKTESTGPREFILIIMDNGEGFDPSQVNSGNGLANLHQRASQLRAVCTIDSKIGVGTEVHLQFRSS
jgi:two-component sensor histidine kinase/streptogramin lyase